ncbi:hypothetical protein DFS33DRAFT_1269994 [Desarmillaria ectypa]|nr:hypothetical protein DFS33DRAFT_1269994 [Desarmillaria ectypa]
MATLAGGTINGELTAGATPLLCVILFSDQWIRANPNVGEAGYSNGINSAILRCSGADDAEPGSSVSFGVLPLNEANLVCIYLKEDIALTLNMLYILSGSQAAGKLLPEGSVYTLPPNSIIELFIPGASVIHEHAFHLHGRNEKILVSYMTLCLPRDCKVASQTFGGIKDFCLPFYVFFKLLLLAFVAEWLYTGQTGQVAYEMMIPWILAAAALRLLPGSVCID